MNDDELLNQALEKSVQGTRGNGNSAQVSGPRETENAPQSSSPQIEYRQWQIGPNDSFRAAGLTCGQLPAAVYAFEEDNWGIFIRRIHVVTDSLIPLPDTANERVLSGMETFWAKKALYRDHGLLYKRGVLLWGPPGGGKTATLALLSQNLVAMGGLIITCANPYLTSSGLAILRRIEPNRPLICIMEDIDELIERFSEHSILALLDGENQVDNIVNIATTNYPERLGARIVNRPSRFDERVLVGMPSAAARRTYLAKAASTLSEIELGRWVQDTDRLSIAHLRELIAAVLCLGQPYDAVLSRLHSMRQPIRERDAAADPFGFQARTTQSHNKDAHAPSTPVS